MKNTRPRLARAVSGGMSASGNSEAVILVPQIVGPRSMPATISPSTGGCPIRLATEPSSRASTMISARSKSRTWTSASVIARSQARLHPARPFQPRAFSPAAMRLIPEPAPAEIDLAAGRQHDRHLRHKRLVGLLPWQQHPGAVGRAEVGHVHSPALKVNPGVNSRHDAGLVGDAQRPGLAFRYRGVKAGLAADHIIGVE